MMADVYLSESSENRSDYRSWTGRCDHVRAFYIFQNHLNPCLSGPLRGLEGNLAVSNLRGCHAILSDDRKVSRLDDLAAPS